MKYMKRLFANELYTAMEKNTNIWVVTGDLGYKMWDEIRDTFPERFINVGAAEQSMMGIGVGLALKGKIPFVYSISSFVLYRAFETIRNYIHHERIPVKIIGSGRDKDYDRDGFSHWAPEDKEVLNVLHNITGYWPTKDKEIPHLIQDVIKNGAPCYINLER